MWFSNSGPKCWWCRGNLSRSRNTAYVYDISYDRDGNKVKVHKGCKAATDNDRKTITAQEKTL